ncbi:Increased DNA methylation 1-like protein, partial [Drosera capensis]
FQERFDPILGPDSGQDLIPHMVYGRDQKDLELGGMYCAILSVKSKVVSALVFRIFGKEVAEIPLVATSSDSQGKGYFQALYACIESLLRDLEFDDIRKSCNVMAFDGTTLLHKSVPKLWAARRH